MDAMLARAGFRREVGDATLMWQMDIYRRAAN
jgi:hypothetical protein